MVANPNTLTLASAGFFGLHVRAAMRSRLRTSSLLFLLSGSVLGVGCHGAESREARGEELYGYCLQCHGNEGEGSHDFRVPAIAGLPDWYVRSQLDKFRIGARGDHPEDVDGLRMRPMSRTLASDAEVDLVAAHVAGLTRVSPTATLEGGDPER